MDLYSQVHVYNDCLRSCSYSSGYYLTSPPQFTLTAAEEVNLLYANWPAIPIISHNDFMALNRCKPPLIIPFCAMSQTSYHNQPMKTRQMFTVPFEVCRLSTLNQRSIECKRQVVKPELSPTPSPANEKPVTHGI